MTYLVDSDWIIDALHGVPEALTTLEQNASDGLTVSIVTYGEIYDGAFSLPDADRHLTSFRRFLDGFNLVGLNDPIMEFFARTLNTLRGQGNIIPDLDLLIASTAVESEFTLMTRNLRHFRRIPELIIFERA